ADFLLAHQDGDVFQNAFALVQIKLLVQVKRGAADTNLGNQFGTAAEVITRIVGLATVLRNNAQKVIGLRDIVAFHQVSDIAAAFGSRRIGVVYAEPSGN